MHAWTKFYSFFIYSVTPRPKSSIVLNKIILTYNMFVLNVTNLLTS